MSYSPAGYWPLDEATGTIAYDVSGNGNHGVYNGSPLLGSRPPPPGMKSFCDFDGANDYVRVASGVALDYINLWTILAIAMFDTTSGSEPTIAAKDYNGTTVPYTLEANAGTTGSPTKIMTAEYSAGWRYVAQNGNFSTGTYYVVAGVYDGTTMSLYLDGALDNSGTRATIGTGGSGFTIGGRFDTGVWGTSYKFDGAIGHVALWNAALTATQIRAIYQTALRAGVGY